MQDLILIIPIIYEDGSRAEIMRFVATLYPEECGAAVTHLADVVTAMCTPEGAFNWFEEN